MGTGCALRRECEAIRAVLISAMAAIEAQIDFFDLEDSEALTLDSVKRAARTARDRIDRALASAKAAGAAGRVKESFVVVIAGPPNVGKSTLMNALAGRDFAITSPFAGTTRDPIEVFLDLRVYPVILVDTAGIREADDPIEREGVNRAPRRAADVDLTLWLEDRDGRRPPIAEGPVLVFHTKIDRPGRGAGDRFRRARCSRYRRNSVRGSASFLTPSAISPKSGWRPRSLRCLRLKGIARPFKRQEIPYRPFSRRKRRNPS